MATATTSEKKAEQEYIKKLPANIQPLIMDLGADEKSARDKASDGLWIMGSKAVPSLIEAMLNDTRPIARFNASAVMRNTTLTGGSEAVTNVLAENKDNIASALTAPFKERDKKTLSEARKSRLDVLGELTKLESGANAKTAPKMTDMMNAVAWEYARQLESYDKNAIVKGKDKEMRSYLEDGLKSIKSGVKNPSIRGVAEESLKEYSEKVKTAVEAVKKAAEAAKKKKAAVR